ncbi:MAG: rhodanese-like domain-containing protein [Flavobacterium sp.]|nr:rhodanese-like domain-containing protein [Flavobacterium sp.]
MKKIVLLFILIGITFSCQSQKNERIKVVSKVEFNTMITKGKVQLIDVRTPNEFNDGFIKGAKNINVNDPNFESEIQKLDKTKPVYIYCRSGARSQTAAKKMVALGFIQIIDLKGGYMNWD